MSKVLLIHGSTVALQYSIFKKADTKYGCFLGVKDLIDDKKVDLHFWGKTGVVARFWELHKILNLYLWEKNQVYTNSNLAKKLFQEIVDKKYTTIICHSMGGELLFETINQYGLPKGVTNIYTLASDSPRNGILKNTETLNRLEKNQLTWTNYNCYWDPSLLTSSLLNLKFPAGLIGIQANYKVKNIFYPLLGRLDLHTSIIKVPTKIKDICTKHLN